MEDGIFLGRVLSEVMRNNIDLDTAIHLYETKRIPRAFHKQQSAFTMGELISVKDEDMAMRDRSISPEVRSWDRNPVQPEVLPPTYRTFHLFASPQTVPSILYYDAEADADFAVDEWLMNHNDIDAKTKVSRKLRQKWWSGLYDNGLAIWDRAFKSDAKL